MKKIIGLLIIFVLILTGIFIKVISTALEPVNTAEEKAVRLAEGKVKFSEVLDFHIYNGLETVNVIEGKDENGEELIVWIPEKSKKVIKEKLEDGLTADEAVQRLRMEANPNKIISVRLGMENEIPFWEIYYRSDNNLINYYYVHFKTGEWLKRIENL